MRRRDFIKAVTGTVAAWPLDARAQQNAMSVVGFVHGASPQGAGPSLSAFLKGLSETGYLEGQNVAIEYRWAEGRIDRLPTLVADLVHRQVAVIAATTTPASLAAKAATTSIPIVFETSADPVKLGLVASLNRPVGNVTGVTQTNAETAPKRLELLHELLPSARVMALPVNPTDSVLAETAENAVAAAARTLGLELRVLRVSTERDFDTVFAKLPQLQAGGLVIGADVLFTSHIEQLAALTVRHAVPAAYQWRQFAAAGGLLSYGSDVTDAYRLVGIYVGRILKGEKPADVPSDRRERQPDSQGREASQPAGSAGYEGRVVHQSQNRQGSWPHRAAIAARHRRRRDRIGDHFAVRHQKVTAMRKREEIGQDEAAGISTIVCV
jgi:putative tryptophan/tyrosine transport system substrate-binding protein